METHCSQQKQTDQMSELDGSKGSSPLEKIICWGLFSKSKWTFSGFCSSCGDHEDPGVEAKGVQIALVCACVWGSRGLFILPIYLSSLGAIRILFLFLFGLVYEAKI